MKANPCFVRLLLMAGGCLLMGQSPAICADPVLFPFVIPWSDSTPNTANDMSFLNDKPAGVHGRIIARGGHFYESKTGKRIKFFGTSITFDAGTPPHEDADQFAKHVAKLGINIIRIHHVDALWRDGVAGSPKLDPEKLERFDYLIAQLKKNGVYLDFSTFCNPAFSAADGLPVTIKQIGGKGAYSFDRHIIDLQKQCARDFLTHVNPYTHLSYAEDPCVVSLEVINESCIVNAGANTAKLPEPFMAELLSLWNTWLSRRYHRDDELRAAWAPKIAAFSLPAKPAWTLSDPTKTAALTPSLSGGGIPDFQLVNPEKGGHPQVSLPHLALAEGASYTVTFRAKSDVPRAVSVGAGLDMPDRRNIGLNRPALLTADWKDYSYTFAVSKTKPAASRLFFEIGDDAGTIWVSNFSIASSQSGDPLGAAQSLQGRSIGYPAMISQGQTADWNHFLADQDLAYADEMRGYLRRDLKVQANIAVTQMLFGGVSSFHREADSDFADDHAYWQHPQYLGDPHETHFYMPNTSMVDGFVDEAYVPLLELAEHRIAGKPFTVSEYNHPAPNDFQAEAFPMLATVAAVQDWDIIYPYEYGDYGPAKPSDKIVSWFKCGADPVKSGFFPACALLFRTGQLAPASQTITLRMAEDAPFAGSGAPPWSIDIVRPTTLFTAKLQSEVRPGASANEIMRGGRPSRKESSIRIASGNSGRKYLSVGDGVVTIAGILGADTTKAGPLTVQCPAFGNGFAALMLSSIDRRPLTSSQRMLLTIGGKAENLEMKWDAARTGLTAWGHGPVQTEGVPATLTLASKTIRHAWALDATGARVKEIPATAGKDGVTVTIGPEYRTIWYELSE